MAHSAIVEILKEIKGEQFNIQKGLISDGWISSFDLIWLVDKLEKRFDIKVPLEKVTPYQFNSVDEILELINEIR